jgi:hypothetical protein
MVMEASVLIEAIRYGAHVPIGRRHSDSGSVSVREFLAIPI